MCEDEYDQENGGVFVKLTCLHTEARRVYLAVASIRTASVVRLLSLAIAISMICFTHTHTYTHTRVMAADERYQ
jgi:hypothetical protein